MSDSGKLDPESVKFARNLVRKGLAELGLPYPLVKDPFAKREKPAWAWPLPQEPEPKSETYIFDEEE